MIIYSAINKDVLLSVPDHAVRILDVGCGNGSFGAALKAMRNVYIAGITHSEREADDARLHLDKVYVTDLNAFDFASIQDYYDCVVCSHVLEHLVEPWHIVSALEKVLAPAGTMIIAVPNLFFFKQRWKLMQGKFTYSHEGGLMDITHLRFFDWHSVDVLYKHSGLRLFDKKAFGMFPQPVLRKIFPQLSASLDCWMVNIFPGLFGLQFVIRLKKDTD